MANIFPKDYKSKLDVLETEKAIVFIKRTFEKELSKRLGLLRVSAPMFVEPETGLNDGLNGVEKAVSFNVNNGTNLEIVHSLAKWKRFALKKYNLSGLFTDMNAIRACEETDNIHSIYVDQWDWERVIQREDRNIEFLKNIVRNIYDALKASEEIINKEYPVLDKKLSDDIYFITSEELLAKYPDLTAKERETAIVKEHGSTFIIGIGDKLQDGTIHDGRASDYDDWHLNGDLLVWNKVLGNALELSSMGIRVDAKSLKEQLEKKNEHKDTFYHRSVLNDELPLTIGGGIGQSRISMFFLEKAHIGEVQSSYWPNEDKEEFAKHNVYFL